MLYTSVPASDSGIWGGGTVSYQGGFLKAFYQLAPGASLTGTYSITYTVPGGSPQSLGQVTPGVDPIAGTNGQNLYWIGGYVPNAALNPGVPTTFIATLTDSLGTTVTWQGTFTFSTYAMYPVNFQTFDGSNPGLGNQPLNGVQIIIYQNGGVVAQVITSNGGQASISLPDGQYSAVPTPPSGYNTTITGANFQPSLQSGPLNFILKRIVLSGVPCLQPGQQAGYAGQTACTTNTTTVSCGVVTLTTTVKTSYITTTTNSGLFGLGASTGTSTVTASYTQSSVSSVPCYTPTGAATSNPYQILGGIMVIAGAFVVLASFTRKTTTRG